MKSFDWVGLFAQLLVVGFIFSSMCRVFEKAGQSGWACLIPLFNCYVLLKIAGKPSWWFWLLFIPIVNAVVTFVAMDAFARQFGRSTGFALGLIFLPYVFFPILAFSRIEYHAKPPVIVY